MTEGPSIERPRSSLGRAVDRLRSVVERRTETPHSRAAHALDEDTAKLREQFIRHLMVDSRAPRTGLDTRLTMDAPKLVRYASRFVLRTGVGLSHLTGSAVAFGAAKAFKDYAAPVFGLADPFSTSATMLLLGALGVAGSRLATARWRDVVENSVIVERIFNDTDKVKSLKDRITAAPANRDAVFDKFIEDNKYSWQRKLAFGAIGHGPMLLLGSWAYDAAPGEVGRVIAEASRGSWSDRAKLIYDLMWSGLVGDSRRGITGLVGHAKRVVGLP